MIQRDMSHQGVPRIDYSLTGVVQPLIERGHHLEMLQKGI